MTRDEALAFDLALEALGNNRRTHYYCEDAWYSCPKHEDGCANEAEGDECNCGADKANQEIDNAITAIKQARSAKQERHFCERCGKRLGDYIHTCTPPAAPMQDSTCNETLRAQGKAYPRTCRKCGLGPCIGLANAALDKKAENARELGLDYEPVAPVQEDWGPGPHEYHSLTAASVQEPVAWRYRGILHEFDPSDWAEGPVTPLYTTPPAQPAPVQEPVALETVYETIVHWDEGGGKRSRRELARRIATLYTTPPNVATPLAAPVQDIGVEQDERVFARIEARKNRDAAHKETAQRQSARSAWVELTDEEMRELEKQFEAERVRTSDEEYLVIYPAAYWQWQRAIEAKLKEKNT